MTHPSDLALEQHLQNRALHAEHIGACARCQGRVAKMEQEGAHFRQFVYPATLEAVEKPRRRWRFSMAWLLVPAGALAAIAVVARTGPSDDYTGTKGAALKLGVYTQARALADGDTVPANAALRFKVQTSAPCELAVLSVDDAGEVSRIYAGHVEGETALPGGAVLDGKPGSERFYAVCAKGLAISDVEKQARAAHGSTLAGLPPGSTQASLLLHKQP